MGKILKMFVSVFCLLCIILLASAKSDEKQPLVVVLDWFVNPNHAPLIVAEQQGFFQQEGLQVKLIQPADPGDAPKLVAVKQADIAIGYQTRLLLQVDQGLPLVRFGALVASPLDCLITLKTSHIERLADLKDKTIGYSSGGTEGAILQTMLKTQGLDLTNVKLVNVRYDVVKALLSNNIQGFSGGMRNVEAVQLEQLGYPVQVFYPENYGVPPYDELIFIAHRDARADPRLTAFLRAVRRGVEYLIAHPQTSWQEAVKAYPQLNNSINEEIWLVSINYFTKDPAALDMERYRQFAVFMQQQGLIKKVPPFSNYTVQLAEESLVRAK